MHQPEMKPSASGAPVPVGTLALGRAVTALSRLLAVLGPGEHIITGSRGFTDIASARIEVVPFGGGMLLSHRAAETMGLAALVGRAFTAPTGAGGGLVVRTEASQHSRERVRGWRMQDGWLVPLTAGEVFSAYCTDALTGEPLSPESDVEYSAGLLIPTPEELS
ncbi:hypothetical protein ACIBCO_40455 [Streptomyces violascens]|uniref:hypothetical protein n=1 Tax=Streptomyces violascens TaxID=67381 RepID=UPI0037B6FBE3